MTVKMAFGALFPVFVCVLLWWRRRRRFMRRLVWRRRMARLMLRQDAEQAFFLAAMMTPAMEASLAWKNTCAQRRSQSFFYECISNWDTDEWKQNNISIFVSGAKATSSEEQRRLNSIVGGNISGHNIMEAGNKHWVSISESSLWCWTFNCLCCSIWCLQCHCGTLSKTIHCSSSQRTSEVGSGWLHVKVGGAPVCWSNRFNTYPHHCTKNNPLDYYNRKGYHLVVLQALVHHDYKFLDVCVGWPGSVHNARVLALYSKCDSGSFPPNWPEVINGTSILLIANPANPLTSWVIKPFSDCGRLTNKQQRFNYHVSRACCVAENAFGRLKGRWRSLMKHDDTDIKFLPNLATACCVLLWNLRRQFWPGMVGHRGSSCISTSSSHFCAFRRQD